MTHFLDKLPFDWTDPASPELRDFLASIYYRVDQVVPLLQQAGIPPAAIALEQPMFQVWHDILERARNRDRLRALLDEVTTNSDAAVAQRLQELTRSKPVLAAQPASNGSADGWRGFDDRGALERLIENENDTLLDVAFLERGLAVASSIARLLVTLPTGQYYGTAFRIGDDLLLTNHHVLFEDPPSELPATAVEAWFGYERDFAGRSRAYTTVSCNPATITGNREDDWAVIRTSDPLPEGAALLPIDSTSRVQVDDRVYIIQHPEGGPKQIGMHHNIVRFADARYVQYWTDTKRGSSGAPVFNEQWEVVALHHRWVESRTGDHREYRNQGITIGRVRDQVAAEGLL
jgi:V8-like Glu-specific endopeptidase